MDDIIKRREALANDVRAVLKKHFPEGESALGIVFTTPPEYDEVHYITNIDAESSKMLFKTAIDQIITKSN